MDLLEFIKRNGRVLIAEGYLLEFTRRGRMRAGSFVPEVVLDFPEAVSALHQEFVDAGSEVVQAFTYYAHRKKIRDIGKEDMTELLNKKALQLAKDVARRNGRLFAGGLSNTTIYEPTDQESIETCTQMFREQCAWAKEAGVDFMIAETFEDYGEASLALKIMKGFGLVSVVSIAPKGKNGTVTFDNVPIPEALRRLEEEGADVVGLNCSRGPQSMVAILKECRKVCKGMLGCLPVCYRTTPEAPTMTRLKYRETDVSCYPQDIQTHLVSHEDIKWFAQQCLEIGVQYVGLCCGNDPSFTRTLCHALGKTCLLSRYLPDLENSTVVGTNPSAQRGNRDFRKFVTEM